MTTEPPSTPAHVEKNIRAVEQLHSLHDESATATERLLENIKAYVTRPLFVVAVGAGVLVWLLVNLVLTRSASAFDPPPFGYLEVSLTVFAAMITILILATQRRADGLAAHREQLILQLAMASEQKTAKIIALLEELRRDIPQVSDRTDHEATEMSEAADPLAVSEALRNVEVENEDTKNSAKR